MRKSFALLAWLTCGLATVIHAQKKLQDTLDAQAIISSITTLPESPPVVIPDVYLTTPVSGTGGYLPKVDVVAKSVSGASTYTIQLSLKPDFTTIIAEKIGARSQRFTQLPYGQHFYARVKTDLSPAFGKTTDFSTVRAEDLSFVVSPADGAINQSPNLTVSCNSVPDALQYTIELNTSPDFTGTSIIKTGDRSQNFTGLSYNTTYYSRVRTEFSVNWGATRSLTIADASVITFVLTPVSGATGQSTTLDVICSQVPGATQYKLKLGNSAFTLFFNSSSRTIRVTGLLPNTAYTASIKTDLSPLFGPESTFSTALAAALTAYPNPTAGQVTIHDATPGSHLKIVDAASGMTVQTIAVDKPTVSIETTHYKKGFYYVIQQNAEGDETESLKLLVE